MKKLTVLFGVSMVLLGMVHAQGVATNVEELKEVAASKETQQLITESDGASIQIAEDGSYQIFARGTGTYHFNDHDDIADATKEATLRAKAAISKFISEKISSDDELLRVAKKVQSQTTDGTNQSQSISKETAKITAEHIRNNSADILTGVITLVTIKQPHGQNGGEVQVTVGVSSLTLKAAQKISQGINQSLQNREGGGNTDVLGNSPALPAAPNEGYIRRSNSAF
ncbi:MAG: hypothetical protein GX927_03820 [Lentisphaerae bacterium]|jgi:hypothetical protein|nr:hypothetical protein [Lentisphaerota bacterium]